jgi:hypothetical protein
MPENVGIPLFGPGSQFRSISIQTHYNNPNKVSNLFDSSGMRLYYTVTPREVEAAWLQIADPFDLLSGTAIPSGLTQYSFSCGGDCSSFVLADGEPVTVIAEGLHMHQTGVRMTNELIRDGEVVNFAAVDVFEFEQQGTFAVQQQDYQIFPGDSFRTTCYYRDGTAFGLSSQEEMCIAFLLYYPAKQLDFGEFGTFPWFCTHGIEELPVCKEELEFMSLTSEEGLGRMFGSAPTNCSATVGGGSEEGGGGEAEAVDDNEEEDGSTTVPTDPPVVNGSSASTLLPTMAVVMALVLNTFIGLYC